MKRLLHLLIGLSVSGTILARDLPAPPKDVPPIIGMAVATVPDPRVDAALPRISLTLPRIQWQVVGEAFPKVYAPKLKTESESVVLTLQVGGPSTRSPSRVLDVSGKELKPAEWSKRLEKPTPVFVSVSGRMVDPYFLQLARPESLIVVLGPRDGGPAPGFLPKEDPAVNAGKAGPVLELTFDFSRNGPFEFIAHLIRQEERGAKMISIPSAPDDWIQKDHIDLLIQLMDSEEPCASIFPWRSSIIPHGKDVKTSTVGHEAAYLIQSFRHATLYPSSIHLSSSLEVDRKALATWWRDKQKQ
ncbi:MAG: hypothetical protein AAF492_01070 [Verrucomicrobiota bacterium]